jgi:hypothetical protein
MRAVLVDQHRQDPPGSRFLLHLGSQTQSLDCSEEVTLITPQVVGGFPMEYDGSTEGDINDAFLQI